MDDVAVAHTPVARVSLDSLEVGGSLRLFVQIPDSAQWRRIRAAWGDHGYIIFFGPYLNPVVVAVAVLMLVASSLLGLLHRNG
jgi:hypothetical protein